MYRVAIGDDDPQFLKEAEQITTRFMEENHLQPGIDYAIETHATAAPLLTALEADPKHYQLILLDVKFGADNGLNVASALRQHSSSFSLIYITSHRDFVFDSFDTHPLHYLLKPLNADKLTSLLREDYRRHCQDVRLYLKSGGKHISLAYQDLYAAEAALHKVLLHLRDSTETWSGSLSELAPALPGWCFCRCHNSFFVNLTHVTELVRYEARLDNGAVIPISKRFYKPAIAQYIAFLKN